MIFCAAYLALPISEQSNRAPSPIRQVFENMVAVLIALSIVGWAVSDLAQFHFYQSLRAAQDKDLDGAVDSIQEAHKLDPGMGFYVVQRAQYVAELAEKQPVVLSGAVEGYDASLALDQTYALIHANDAIVLAAAGQGSNAVSQMQEAISWQNSDPRYILAYGILAEQNNEIAVALDAYENALELRSMWVESSFWSASPLRTTALNNFLTLHGLSRFTPATLGSVPPECWPAEPPIATVAGWADTEICRAERSLRWESNPHEAIALSTQSLARDPASAAAYLLRGAAYYALGDRTHAEIDARTALFLQDNHAYTLLGQIAEDRGDSVLAEADYKRAGPLIDQPQGWDVSVYARRGDLGLLPQLALPGPSRYDFAGWDALVKLYESQGRADEAAKVRDIIRSVDPFHGF